MSKIKVKEYFLEGVVFKTQYLYFCPGCGYEHAFALKSEGGHHNFNMDLDNPTVSPSLLQNFVPGKTCHSYIKGGKIQYLSDCWHSLKGQTVEIPEREDLEDIGK